MLPKPKFCGQSWLEMCPTQNGRICPGCNKVITDFTKSSWKEIEQLQIQNNNSICGMYSNNQLKYWGQEVPRTTFNKTLSAIAIATSIVVTPVLSQENTVTKTFVRGTTTGISRDGAIDTLPYATIQLINTPLRTISDENGKYEFDISNYIDTLKNPTLLISYVGFNTLEVILDTNQRGEMVFNAQLPANNMDAIAFYIKRPTFGERMNWKIKNLFRRKSKNEVEKPD